MQKGKWVRWVVIGFAIIAILGISGVIVARALPPRQQASLINRLPGFLQPLARSMIIPDLPKEIAAANVQSTIDIAALLTPVAPTHTPILPHTETPAPQDIDTPIPTPQPTLAPVTQASAPNVTAVVPPSQTQAVRSTPADLQTANVFLTGFKHIYQTWNNCGPATLSMNLSYYGIDVTQAQAAQFLKPNVEDKNVSPHELVAFAQSMGFNAVKRVNGSHQMLKSFLQSGIPVLIEKGFEPDATSGWEGHYELIIGYNDARGEFIAMDSYTGPNQSIPYDNLDWYWSHFNRTYIIVYTDTQAETVMQLLGVDADATSNIAAALAAAQSEAAANPNNTFAWFNIGTNMADLGEYESAAAAYDQARSLDLPWRMTWYQFNIFEAYYHTARFDDVIALADATLARTPDLEELWYYRGLVHQARGQLDAAREQFNKALVYNPNFQPAVDALANL